MRRERGVFREHFQARDVGLRGHRRQGQRPLRRQRLLAEQLRVRDVRIEIALRGGAGLPFRLIEFPRARGDRGLEIFG